MAGTFLYADGFETGTNKGPWMSWDAGYVYPVVDAVKTGTYSLFMQYPVTAGWLIPGTLANPSISLWIYLKNIFAIDGSVRLEFVLTNGDIIDLRWDSTNSTFDAYVDGNKVADGSETIPSNDWFNVQFYAVINDSGSIKVKLDDTESVNYYGDTLPAGASAEVEYFKIHIISNTADALRADDLVIGTGDYMEVCHIDYLVPTADTAVDDWTPTSGDSYSVVDEAPVSDVDYLYETVNTSEVELDVADWVGTDKTVFAVAVWGRMKEDAATGEAVKLGVDSGGVDNATQYTVTDDWEYNYHTMELDPDTSAPWTDSAIDALKLRLEAVI